jgi:hypothetical protein
MTTTAKSLKVYTLKHRIQCWCPKCPWVAIDISQGLAYLKCQKCGAQLAKVFS